jgi:hypothetical protein
VLLSWPQQLCFHHRLPWHTTNVCIHHESYDIGGGGDNDDDGDGGIPNVIFMGCSTLPEESSYARNTKVIPIYEIYVFPKHG